MQIAVGSCRRRQDSVCLEVRTCVSCASCGQGREQIVLIMPYSSITTANTDFHAACSSLSLLASIALGFPDKTSNLSALCILRPRTLKAAIPVVAVTFSACFRFHFLQKSVTACTTRNLPVPPSPVTMIGLLHLCGGNSACTKSWLSWSRHKSRRR